MTNHPAGASVYHLALLLPRSRKRPAQTGAGTNGRSGKCIRCQRPCSVIPSESDENISKARARRMNCNARIFCFLVLTFAALGGCSSGPSAKECQESRRPPGQNPGESPSSGGIGRGSGCRSERGWTFRVPLGRRCIATACSLRTPVEIVHGKRVYCRGRLRAKGHRRDWRSRPGQERLSARNQAASVSSRMAWSDLSFDAFDADCLAFERQGETVSRQAHIPGYADTARYICGNQRRIRGTEERGRGEGRSRSLRCGGQGTRFSDFGSGRSGRTAMGARGGNG